MKAPESLSLLILSTSFPRFREDEASVFVGRLVDAFEGVGLSGTIVVPSDTTVREDLKWGCFRVCRYRYGLFRSGRLAFGNGILPNLRKKPSLVFQVPLLLLRQVEIGWRLRKDWQVLHGNWVVTAGPAWLLSFLLKRPFVVTLRGEDVKFLSNAFFRPFFRLFLRRAYRIVTVAEHLREPCASTLNIPLEKFVCIPNGVTSRAGDAEDISSIQKRYALTVGKKYLVYVGRVIPLKRPEVLISLLELALFKDFSILLVGRITQEYQQELALYAEQHGVAERVRFLGSVVPQEVRPLLSSARYYVSASTHEGRSNSLIEALAAGLPVIASDIAGHRETVAHGRTGFLFREELLSELAGLVRPLEEQEEVYQAFSESARQSPVCVTAQEAAERYRELFLEASHERRNIP